MHFDTLNKHVHHNNQYIRVTYRHFKQYIVHEI